MNGKDIMKWVWGPVQNFLDMSKKEDGGFSMRKIMAFSCTLMVLYGAFKVFHNPFYKDLVITVMVILCAFASLSIGQVTAEQLTKFIGRDKPEVPEKKEDQNA